MACTNLWYVDSPFSRRSSIIDTLKVSVIGLWYCHMGGWNETKSSSRGLLSGSSLELWLLRVPHETLAPAADPWPCEMPRSICIGSQGRLGDYDLGRIIVVFRRWLRTFSVVQLQRLYAAKATVPVRLRHWRFNANSCHTVTSKTFDAPHSLFVISVTCSFAWSCKQSSFETKIWLLRTAIWRRAQSLDGVFSANSIRFLTCARKIPAQWSKTWPFSPDTTPAIT